MSGDERDAKEIERERRRNRPLRRLAFRFRKPEVIGLVRYSIIFKGWHPFQDKHDSFEERAHRLYAPARLATRLRLFSTLTVPSLLGQTDPDFRLIVATSSLLPDAHRRALVEAVAPLGDRARIASILPNAPFRKEIRRAARSMCRRYDRPVLTFRLDDDDALASDVVARLRANARSSELIDFPDGYFISKAPNGCVALAPAHRKLIACGLALSSRKSGLRTIFADELSHTSLDQRYRLTSLREPSWLVSAHDLNDSDRLRFMATAQALTLGPEEARAFLGPRFAAIDVNGFAR